MLRIAIALAVLFATCAVASTASAQQRVCERVLFHVLPQEGCVRESVESYKARQDERRLSYRVQEARQADYERMQRFSYSSPADHIQFGVYPESNMGTYRGWQYGRPGQWDHWNWGGYSSPMYLSSYSYGGYYYRDPDFAGGKFWVIPYNPFGTECPTKGPPNTAAPHNYEWRCERGVDANWAAYVKKGRKWVLRDLAQSGEREGAIIVAPKSNNAG